MNNNFEQNNNETNNEADYNSEINGKTSNESNENTNEEFNSNLSQNNNSPLVQPNYPRNKKFTFLALIICMIFFFYNYNSINEKMQGLQDIQNTQSTQNVQTEKQINSSNIAHVNESVSAVFKITFAKVNDNFINYKDNVSIEKGFKVVEAVFDFENVTSKDRTIDIFECYADDIKCEQFYEVEGYKDAFGQNVSPYRKYSNVTVYFLVPENAKKIEIEYEKSSVTDEKFIFVVQDDVKNKDESDNVMTPEETTTKRIFNIL